MLATISFNYFGSTITARSLGAEFVPPLDQTVTAHCVPLTDDNKVVAVDVVNRGVDMPGGHIEEGETAEDAMRREAYEEAFVRVEEPVLIDVWYLSSDNARLGLTAKPYLLLYAAKVQTMEKFVPNDEVSKRLVLTPHEFVSHYFGSKEQAEIIVAKAISILT